MSGKDFKIKQDWLVSNKASSIEKEVDLDLLAKDLDGSAVFGIALQLSSEAEALKKLERKYNDLPLARKSITEKRKVYEYMVAVLKTKID